LAGLFRNAVRVGLGCSRGMDRTLQVLAAHCELTWCSDVAAPCSHLPSQQTGNSSSSTSSRLLQQRLLQHSTMHTTAASVGQQDTRTGVPAHTRTHMCTHTHEHTHVHAHTHTNTNTRVCTQRRAHTHTLARTQTHTHARAHIHAQTHRHTHTYIYTHTRAHAHTRMHMHAHVARMMGFSNYSASLAMLPHLSSFKLPIEFVKDECGHTQAQGSKSPFERGGCWNLLLI